MQIEESAIPTPLIAGPEGQQVTVGWVRVDYIMNKPPKNISIVSDIKSDSYVRQNAGPVGVHTFSNSKDLDRCRAYIARTGFYTSIAIGGVWKESATAAIPFSINRKIGTVKNADDYFSYVNGVRGAVLRLAGYTDITSLIRDWGADVCCIKHSMQVYPFALSDAQLAALTTIPE